MWLRTLSALVLAGSMIGHAYAADSLAALVAQGQYQVAYEQALERQLELAGEPQFDFLFGLAALESGHPQQAVFALERTLAAVPQDHRARLELARAYFALGNFEQARSLFNTVLASDPPAQVKENIQRFLEQLAERRKLRDHQLNVSTELKLGYDSNISSGTTQQAVATVIFPALQLSETSRELGDEFAEVNAGISYLKLLRKDMGYFVSASLNERQNSHYNLFNTRLMGLSGGFVYQAKGHSLRLPLQYQYLQYHDANGDHSRTSAGLGVEWSLGDRSTRYVLFSQWAQQRYSAGQESRDVDLALAGVAVSTDIAMLKTGLSASAYYADESPQTTGSEYFGRAYGGVRLVATWRPHSAHNFELALSAQQVEHDAVQPLFGKLREDDYRQAALAWHWRFDPRWRFSMGLSHTRNDSNLPIYTYQRAQQYLSLRFDY